MDTLDTTGPALTATGPGAGQVVPDTSQQQPASLLDEALGALPFPQK